MESWKDGSVPYTDGLTRFIGLDELVLSAHFACFPEAAELSL